jgi:hypothetical protein
MSNYDPHKDDLSGRYGIQGSNDGQGSDQGFWPWLAAALTAIALLIGGTIGHQWGWSNHERLAQSSQPATTGSAPSQNR